MSAPRITSDDVSIFLLDKPQFNTLVEGARWDTYLIEKAMFMTVDYYNSAPPSTGSSATIETFPSQYQLLIGTSGHLLRGSAINQASNEFNYTAEGLTVQDHDKSQIFASLGNSLWQEYQQWVRDKKIIQNLARTYGHIGSEYRFRDFY